MDFELSVWEQKLEVVKKVASVINFPDLLTRWKWNITPLLGDFGGRVGIFSFLYYYNSLK